MMSIDTVYLLDRLEISWKYPQNFRFLSLLCIGIESGECIIIIPNWSMSLHRFLHDFWKFDSFEHECIYQNKVTDN